MDSTELRIGNFISFINRSGEIHIPQTHPLKVMDISLFKIKACQIDELFAQVEKPIILDNRDVCEIPLTEEWLLKFGFHNDKGHLYLWYVKGNRICTITRNHGGFKVNGHSYFLSELEHVHQLQNLYYSLTGHELKIK